MDNETNETKESKYTLLATVFMLFLAICLGCVIGIIIDHAAEILYLGP